jgi:RNA polymerase sigma-70 factor (ECF subfamily)
MNQSGHTSRESAAWREYRTELYRFVLKRVRNEASAEDIVHDVLVKAYSRRGTLEDPSKLRSWLYQITRNTIVDFYRAQRPMEEIPDELVGEDSGDAGEGAARELASCLRPLLRNLPESYREPLNLVDLGGVTQRELASQLGLSLSGAKSRVQRGRKMLRDLVLDCCRVELDHRGGVVDYESRGGCDPCGDSD